MKQQLLCFQEHNILSRSKLNICSPFHQPLNKRLVSITTIASLNNFADNELLYAVAELIPDLLKFFNS